MILHEVYFEGLGGDGKPRGMLAGAIARDFGSIDRWRTEFAAMGKAEGAVQAGRSSAIRRRTNDSSTNGLPII